MRLLKILCIISLLSLSGCTRSSEMIAGLKSKWQQLKQIWGDDTEGMLASEGFYGPVEDEFIPLEEEDLSVQFAEAAIPQPREVPGIPGSNIPSLDQFKRAFAHLADIFQNVNFNTNDYVLRKPEYTKVIDRVAQYLKKNPNTYVSVSGHCDERGSEAYNLALGTRRSNYIRSLLVRRGVDPNHVHSVSYGKEQPVDMGHNRGAWSRNRRVEFKIWERP